ncbi:DEKNAAC104091 [Brettanomyces naardenensis]|uniref:DEKNAAC104091 n=1 Tax=Brettanomyces naardenensis TaxID=13370 RepID=A0A448YPT2_BRENA|nr:DEKNAAC104091 [Brettanomyces naardenensis]
MTTVSIENTPADAIKSTSDVTVGEVVSNKRGFADDSDSSVRKMVKLSSDAEDETEKEETEKEVGLEIDDEATDAVADSADGEDLDESGLTEYDFESDPDAKETKKLWEMDPMPPLQSIKITKNTCNQARAYLKTEGYMKFLDLFVPPDPTADDIITLAKLLGYVPNDVEKLRKAKNQQEFLHRCIVYLREAINRVLRSRTRLPNFHTLDDVCEALKKAKNILILTGAGISTSLGIPDFRSSTGFYSKMRNLGLDDPQDVFSIDVFREDPSILYNIAHMILPPDKAYTPLHSFIKLLQDRGKLLRNYTQNIDNLEANAGVLPEKLVQCHGSFATASCITCKYKVPGEVLFPNLRSKKIAYCPFCAAERKALLQKYDKMEDEGIYSRRFEQINSFGVMKPDITFFGEDLPERYHNFIKEDIKKCDLLLCIGTSLKVAPVSEIVNRVPNDVPQILINRDPIDHCEFDVELLGYCDQAITWLCGKKLGWKINHKDFDKVLNSGLEMKVLDEAFGSYQITDEEQREGKEKISDEL